MPVYDGAFELDFIYNVTISSLTLQHHHTFDVNADPSAVPGTPFSDVELIEKSGLTTSMPVFIQDYLDVWSPLLGATTTLEDIILWKYDPEPSLAKTFIASLDFTPTLGFTGTSTAAHSGIFTFRSLGGKTPTRMYFMEPNFTGETRSTGSGITGAALAYMNYCIGLTSPIVGRNDNYLVSKIALNRGQNEHLRNLRFRSGV